MFGSRCLDMLFFSHMYYPGVLPSMTFLISWSKWHLCVRRPQSLNLKVPKSFFSGVLLFGDCLSGSQLFGSSFTGFVDLI